MEYSETQKMKNPIVWFIVIGNLVLFLVLLYCKLFLKIEIGNHPAPSILLVIHFIMALALILFFASMKLKTTINSEGIYYSFAPINSPEVLKWSDIKKITFIKDSYFKNAFGKNPPKKAVMFNISNSYGIYVESKQVRKNVVIGTSQLPLFKDAIDKFALSEIVIENEVK
jgi:hypothetical protein